MAQRYLLLALGGRRRLPGVLLQQLLCGRGLPLPRPRPAQVSDGPRAGRLCVRAGPSVAAEGRAAFARCGPSERCGDGERA